MLNMKKMTEVLKHRWLLLVMLCVMSLGVISFSSCAGTTKTSTVTTQTTDDSGSVSSGTVTTKKEVTTDAHPRGVIGGLFYTIGQILLFPFRVIGNLF